MVIEAKDCERFAIERGSHRIQRVPPTEKRGRVHTSTITVGVLFRTEQATPYDKIADEDFEYRLFSGTGAGGQHRNKHQNSVVMTHIPTGLKQTAVGKSKERNLVEAKSRLLAMLVEQKRSTAHEDENRIRHGQIGNGMRGEKKRTYRFQEDQITDHETGRSMSCKAFMRGNIEKLW